VAGDVGDVIAVSEEFHHQFLLDGVSIFRQPNLKRGFASHSSKSIERVGQSDVPSVIDRDVHRDIADRPDELPNAQRYFVAASSEAASDAEINSPRHDYACETRNIRGIVRAVSIHEDDDFGIRASEAVADCGALSESWIREYGRAGIPRDTCCAIGGVPVHYDHPIRVIEGTSHHVTDRTLLIARGNHHTEPVTIGFELSSCAGRNLLSRHRAERCVLARSARNQDCGRERMMPRGSVVAVASKIMSATRQVLGERGERVAEQYLERKGGHILSRRFRSGHRDIDLVAEWSKPDGVERMIAFVEVKTRVSPAYGGPLGAVHWRKQRELVRAARDWMARFHHSGDAYRFDVVGVVFGAVSGPEVIHIENAFTVR
jgi:putative endonuclease